MFVRFFGMLLAIVLALPVLSGGAQAQQIGNIASATGRALSRPRPGAWR